MSDANPNYRDQQRAEGINSVNQQYRRYEQVEKNQTYGLSENADVDRFDDEFEIRVCDMADWFDGGEAGKARFSASLGEALEEIGFAILVNHGVDPALYEQADRRIREFFETIPTKEREPYLARRHGSVNQGYFPVNETTIIHPDQVEGWVFCRRAFDLDGDPDYDEHRFWPRPGFEPRFRELIRAQEPLILPIMQAVLRHLGCDPHLYDEKLTGTNFGFRLNYYPPMDPSAAGGGRMLGHEDVDLFTILPAPGEEGLQVLNRASMKWIRLNPPEGSIIINTGDYMQRISNDRLPSTTHRVARPRDPEAMTRARTSFPMAIYVWEDEILEVLPETGEPKYPPILAEDFHTRITSKYYGDDYASS
ncbi:MAG: 2-oxoglutarate and iron-dependent oxygenase domain-containing protein [Wenzhouxiangellaceae bacterium]|nr:2-oxoglutarate and iron-dependent oxygenase domain-containing protein [Wenzhouxiangellaceae bacterium]